MLSSIARVVVLLPLVLPSASAAPCSPENRVSWGTDTIACLKGDLDVQVTWAVETQWEANQAMACDCSCTVTQQYTKPPTEARRSSDTTGPYITDTCKFGSWDDPDGETGIHFCARKLLPGSNCDDEVQTMVTTAVPAAGERCHDACARTCGATVTGHKELEYECFGANEPPTHDEVGQCTYTDTAGHERQGVKVTCGQGTGVPSDDSIACCPFNLDGEAGTCVGQLPHQTATCNPTDALGGPVEVDTGLSDTGSGSTLPGHYDTGMSFP
jgi:hypothetical protein